MKEIELIKKRKPREKHFLREDGTFVAKVYSDDIHYKKGNMYEEIDNTLTKEGEYYYNKSNDFKVRFKNNGKHSLMYIEKDNNYLDIMLNESNRDSSIKMVKKSKLIEDIIYPEILEDLDIEYKTLPTKIKETIILKNNKYDKLNFIINTNLNLKVENSCIIARKDGKEIFKIHSPYMEDSEGNKNNNIHYNLYNKNQFYEVELILDKDWLSSPNIKYPVYVDPTISNSSQTSGIYDTYIYPNDDKVDRNSHGILKAGVQRLDGEDIINRTLIKFDLPEIGTGSEIVEANLYLIGYISDTYTESNMKLVTMHRITQNWDENTASWNEMHDKYDNSKIESIYYGGRSYMLNAEIIPEYGIYNGNITNIVKKWYKDTPNYGLLLKSAEEIYDGEDYPAFYSKSIEVTGDFNPMPMFQVIYRNQNGLEGYFNTRIQEFSIGNVYINTYNGNVTGVFDIGYTVGGKNPIDIALVYNSNDIVLNKNIGYGLGNKLSLHQTIAETIISNEKYLEYIDEDGTAHYFFEEKDIVTGKPTGIYVDEEGLNFSIQKEENICILKDKKNNVLTFNKHNDKYYLTNITNSDDDSIIITYDNNNRITKVKDKYNQEINLTYNDNNITIQSADASINTLQFENSKLVSITTKEGVSQIEYNSNNLISKITDVTGLKMQYEYYDNKPYKVKKVTQYGINNSLGQSLMLNYGVNTTTLTDNKGINETLVFDHYGNLLSTNSLNSSEDINNAYSIVTNYETNLNNKNKIIYDSYPVKYIKNYLKNSSFENDENYFLCSESIVQSFSTEYCNSGSRSLKITNTSGSGNVDYSLSVPKEKNYTFSGYFKSSEPFNIVLSYVDKNGENQSISELVDATSEFERNDISIYYPLDATSNLKISIVLLSINEIYIDDIQLEEGEVANEYNIIENSDFSEGFSDWIMERLDYKDYQWKSGDFLEISKFNNNQNTALKVKMNPLYANRFSKTLPIKGKKGELYTISFWYKNEGIPCYAQTVSNDVMIYFKPVGHEAEYCIIPSESFNINENIWQYFSFRSQAPEDFESIKITFSQARQANNLYITNLSFHKEVTCGEYSYDNNGNLISIKDQSNYEDKFEYDTKNELTSVETPTGKKTTFEYDKKLVDQILNSNVSSGISQNIKYDENSNPISVKIVKSQTNGIDSGLYKIRSKGTNRYLKAKYRDIMLEENDCSNTVWNIIKIDDKYKFVHPVIPEFSLSIENNLLCITDKDENNLFSISQNENKYYIIKSNNENWVKLIRANNDNLEIVTGDKIEEKDDNIEFCFISAESNLFYETNYSYTDDGRFLASETNSASKTKTYTTNPLNGNLVAINDFNGVSSQYEYNNKNQITKISTGNKVINYTYNTNNLLSQISEGDRQYNFDYDDFLNIKSVKLGNSNVLSTNAYENNNGNLVAVNYGNNQSVKYTYDEFNRLKSIFKENDIYNYKYDNKSNISKIISNDHLIKCSYDISNRLYRYIDNNFKIKYTYNSENNIISQTYKLNNNYNQISHTYNEDNLLAETSIDNLNVKYIYDDLGRLSAKKLNNLYEQKYNYITYGKRTTEMIKDVINGNEKISYSYNDMGNIEKIYINDNLTNQYEYDIYNRLIIEKNYEEGYIEEYSYDIHDNLILDVVKDITTNQIINTNNFQYENKNWSDQLTKFNNENIIYDAIGNTVSFGNNTLLSWSDGRVLHNYTDNSKNLNITYKYNYNGVRDAKIVNGEKTEYYVENDKIIYEKKGNQIIYYLYDLTGLIGLSYNSNIYYYKKNLLGDIIGILDVNYQPVVKYKYDSWGKILKISDSSGNEITDDNHIGIINPFRYRGYYYDNETNLYYLNKRYYNPALRRFLNTDGILGADSDTLNYNLYIYVGNNPINYYDKNGNSALTIGLGILGALGSAFLKASIVTALTIVAAATTESIINAVSRSTTSKKKSNTTKKKNNSNKVNNHNVYVLRDKETKTIEYVGRTTNLKYTEERHARNPFRTSLKIDPIATNVSKETARGLEQMWILQCHTLNKNKEFPKNNQINGVASNNPQYNLFWDMALEWESENEHLIPCP